MAYESTCRTCGEVVAEGEFHSYDSCVLYKLEHDPARMNDQDRRHVWQAGTQAMRDRVERRETP